MSGRGRVVLAYPGDLETRTGGYIYDRRLAMELEASGWSVERLSLGEGFPFPTPQALSAASAHLARIEGGTTVLIDGLALGAMPDVAAEAGRRLDLVALVHHPLCLETGLTQPQAEELEASECAALAATRAVVVTSRRTAATLASLLGVPKSRIVVAVPGTDPAPPATGSADGVVRMLCVGTVTPRKGQELLVEALSDIPRRWELVIGGSLDRAPATTARLRAAITAAGLADRIRLAGELSAEALDAHYDACDLFVSASLYEGYGMALAEALARGLPIVAAAGGAVPDTVPPEAGLLVPPGDVPALRAALRDCIQDRGLLARLRAGALAERTRLPTWADTAAIVAETLVRDAR